MITRLNDVNGIITCGTHWPVPSLHCSEIREFLPLVIIRGPDDPGKVVMPTCNARRPEGSHSISRLSSSLCFARKTGAECVRRPITTYQVSPGLDGHLCFSSCVPRTAILLTPCTFVPSPSMFLLCSRALMYLRIGRGKPFLSLAVSRLFTGSGPLSTFSDARRTRHRLAVCQFVVWVDVMGAHVLYCFSHFTSAGRTKGGHLSVGLWGLPCGIWPLPCLQNVVSPLTPDIKGLGALAHYDSGIRTCPNLSHPQ